MDFNIQHSWNGVLAWTTIKGNKLKFHKIGHIKEEKHNILVFEFEMVVSRADMIGCIRGYKTLSLIMNAILLFQNYFSIEITWR